MFHGLGTQGLSGGQGCIENRRADFLTLPDTQPEGPLTHGTYKAIMSYYNMMQA